MKRVFWLMSAVGLTLAQSSAAQTNYTTDAYVASVPDVDIDNAINSLIASSTQGSRTTTYYQAGTAPAATNFSANFQSAAPAQLTANSAPSIAAKFASRAAHSSSLKKCALYVRRALQAAGYQFTPQVSAYMYASNGILANAGFVKLKNDGYVPQVGDVAVFNRTSRNPHGHIQIYDGNQWVSDFRQNKFSPYAQHNGYSVWRDARYIDASANTGTVLAMNDQ
ncbi:CHAP domain-containing protein [Moraxella pluranimalium]|uniref:CHAP domain-containing protein n=1 Tax=Moraxella pluranimalium TaxID=470453 RepID=A0A1T0CKQ3_9GAMM|nr:CHAP domain-containing protein [Moraxella pluranimalium]OOS22938.1 CHAP domain-containing protein [Moraxella pluranimalium]